MADASSVSSQVLTTLGVGSGLDVFKLAKDLTDVEKVPKQEAIQNSIDATEWNVNSIKKRQKELSKTACGVWQVQFD